jgi:hypothetical protein
MGNCCSGGATVPSSSPPRPSLGPTQAPSPSTHPTSTPSPYVASSSKGIRGMPAHDTTQHSYEMTTLSPKHPSPSSGSNPHSQEMRSHPFQSRGPRSQLESGLASGTDQVPADKQERRSLFTSVLQSVLSNDFRYVVRFRAVSHNNCCTIIHRFRILVVGKVCIMYHTDRRRN